MATLVEQPVFEPGIFQLETSTPVLGGPGGPSNAQAQALANRTLYLKNEVDGLKNSTATGASTAYVQAELAKRDGKQSVRVATTGPISLNGLQVIDGVDVVAGNRVLVKDQAAASANGLYSAATGGWSRTADADAVTEELTTGAEVTVEEGLVNAATRWRLITPAPVILGTSAVTWRDVNAGYLKANNAAMTGNPTAPTQARGTDNTTLATMAALAREVGTMVAAVMPFASPVAPAGWLAANGAAVSRTLYAALFAAIGTRYGAGDGATTFNLPDARGEFIRGWDNGRGVDPGRAMGSAQGFALHWHTHGVSDPGHGHGAYVHPNGDHAHGVNDPGHAHSVLASGGDVLTGGGSFGRAITAQQNTSASGTGIWISNGGWHGHSIDIYGAATNISIQGAGDTETRPRNLAMLMCIKF
jgi:phage-related tail fiber protein